MYTQEDLEALKVVELKPILADLNLSNKGLKADLISRILEHQVDGVQPKRKNSSSSTAARKNSISKTDRKMSETVDEIPSSPKKVPTSPKQAPTSPKNLPTSPKNLPTSPKNLPTSPKNLPTSPKNVPTSPKNVPTSPKNVPTSPKNLPTSPKNLPTSPKNLPTSPKNLPTSPKNLPTSPKNVPTSPKNVPTSPKNVPTSPKNVPTSPKNVPTSPKNVPTSPKNLPTSPVEGVATESIIEESEMGLEEGNSSPKLGEKRKIEEGENFNESTGAETEVLSGQDSKGAEDATMESCEGKSTEEASEKMQVEQPAVRRQVDETGGVKFFVGGITKEMTHEAFTKHFEQFGELVESKIILDRATGENRNFGFVTYVNKGSKDKLFANGTEQVIDGAKIDIRLDKQFEEQEGYKKKVFVRGRLEGLPEEEFMAFFKKFPGFDYGVIPKDNLTGKSRGFAFVCYDTVANATKVVESPAETHFIETYYGRELLEVAKEHRDKIQWQAEQEAKYDATAQDEEMKDATTDGVDENLSAEAAKDSENTEKKTAEETENKTAEETENKTAEENENKTAENTENKTAEETEKKTAEETEKKTAEETTNKSAETADKAVADQPEVTKPVVNTEAIEGVATDDVLEQSEKTNHQTMTDATENMESANDEKVEKVESGKDETAVEETKGNDVETDENSAEAVENTQAFPKSVKDEEGNELELPPPTRIDLMLKFSEPSKGKGAKGGGVSKGGAYQGGYNSGKGGYQQQGYQQQYQYQQPQQHQQAYQQQVYQQQLAAYHQYWQQAYAAQQAAQRTGQYSATPTGAASAAQAYAAAQSGGQQQPQYGGYPQQDFKRQRR